MESIELMNGERGGSAPPELSFAGRNATAVAANSRPYSMIRTSGPIFPGARVEKGVARNFHRHFVMTLHLAGPCVPG
ncbi:hypothetical protein EVAR_66175_1 [Eumeta japonica]|uniref:Uncharacterized protein n=1 Tax=Eumeta variegata TaxID=151549 RepID=A0A4C1ZPT0_EUMVA|nr:hypothetical protein EVAR_66175_1 [Eumeta japonica]